MELPSRRHVTFVLSDKPLSPQSYKVVKRSSTPKYSKDKPHNYCLLPANTLAKTLVFGCQSISPRSLTGTVY